MSDVEIDGDGEGNVISIKRAVSDPDEPHEPALMKKKGLSYNARPCAHGGGVWLDTELRTLECRSCGATVEPFEWLYGYMSKWSGAWENFMYARKRHHEYIREEREIKKSLASLRGKVKRAEARLKKLEEK